MKTKTVDYRSWSEFLDSTREIADDATTGRGRSWSGDLQTIGDARRTAEFGWPEGMERVRTISLPTVSTMAGRVKTEDGWGWDVQGVSYDVGEYLSGNPECWIAPVVAEEKPAITIMANITSSGGISAEHLEMRGAAVVALTLALQQAGYIVNVYATVGMSITDPEADTIWQRVCLTDSGGGPIDTDRLLFALAHPASPRQLFYGNGEKEQGFPVEDHYMLPWPKGGPNARPPEEWHADLYLHAVYLADANWSSAESVSAWVAEQYATLTRGGDEQA